MLAAGAPETYLADAADRGERRPQLVRHVGGETSHLLERGFETSEQIVDDGRQASNLVVRIVHGEALAQPLGRDAARAFGHLIYGSQRTPCQRVTPDGCGNDAEWQTEHEHQREV